jgi:hypothetical protein
MLIHTYILTHLHTYTLTHRLLLLLVVYTAVYFS